MMPTGGKKEGESSGDESKKRSASPATDNNDSDSVDGGRRSRRKKTKVSSVCIVTRRFPRQDVYPNDVFPTGLFPDVFNELIQQGLVTIETCNSTALNRELRTQVSDTSKSAS